MGLHRGKRFTITYLKWYMMFWKQIKKSILFLVYNWVRLQPHWKLHDTCYLCQKDLLDLGLTWLWPCLRTWSILVNRWRGHWTYNMILVFILMVVIIEGNTPENDSSRLIAYLILEPLKIIVFQIIIWSFLELFWFNIDLLVRFHICCFTYC